MRSLFFLRPIADHPDDQGFHEKEEWVAPLSTSLNEPFEYEELEDVLDAVKTETGFPRHLKVTDADVGEDGYVSIYHNGKLVLETEDIRDKIATPIGAWPQEVKFFIIADDDGKYFWIVVFPARQI